MPNRASFAREEMVLEGTFDLLECGIDFKFQLCWARIRPFSCSFNQFVAFFSVRKILPSHLDIHITARVLPFPRLKQYKDLIATMQSTCKNMISMIMSIYPTWNCYKLINKNYPIHVHLKSKKHVFEWRTRGHGHYIAHYDTCKNKQACYLIDLMT